MRGLRFGASIASALALLAAIAIPSAASTTASSRYTINCRESPLCLEVANPAEAFGSTKYVGHDEPSTLFYSDRAGSGNSSTYRVTLPKDPPPVKTNTFNFQLHPAFWFGMALCNTQSYPEQVSTCTPDSDTNIANNPNPSAPDFMGRHAGTAFLELQFYPPGWAPLPAGDSCDASHWCVATVIWSLAEDPINGTLLNTSCTNFIGGSVEYPNFAFLTHNGVAQAPANIIDATSATFTPDLSKDLLMNSGDQLVVDIHDTAQGLSMTVKDVSSGVSGAMTASIANGFGMVQYVTDPATTCNNIPYAFHPMYSTSSEATRVIWAAHSYNVAFSDEIGHFDYCTGVSQGGYCYGNEGSPNDVEKTDGDDFGCFNSSQSTLVKVAGCIGTNTGFDGVPYQPVWPDGSANHPTSILFGSPLTNGKNYSRVAFEADLPRIEAADFGGACNRVTGAGCTRIPVTDEGAPANFYPFFSTQQANGSCTWALGNDNPGVTTHDFGKNDQYGPLLFLNFLQFGGGGAIRTITDDFRGVLSSNPCPAAGGEGGGH
ncbi:MAG TPA: hypothetical protein VN895_05480 [Candidatus Acidoferrum sp.]|nr:hypothetical protein [Candidatus Acidoferrum sp.]